jgi:O-antigen/teichoic acid export membrane protein
MRRFLSLGNGAFGALSMMQVTTVIAGLGVGTLLARGLGVNGYGQYIFALTVVQFMLLPLNFGLPTLLTREVAVLRSQNEWPVIAGLLRWSAGLVVVVFGVLMLGVGLWQWVAGANTALYLFAIALAGIWAYLRLASGILRGMERVVWSALPDQVIRPLTMLVALSIVPLIVPLTPPLAMAIHALAAAVGLGSSLWLLVWRYPPVPAGVRARYYGKKWLRSVVPLGLHTGAGLFNRRIDILMLGVLADNTALGVYGLAALIGMIAGMPQAIVNQIDAPKFARYHAEQEIARIGSLGRESAVVALAGGMTIVAGTVVLGEYAVIALVGEEFRASIPIAIIVCLGPTIAAGFGAVNTILNMSGYERQTARVAWLCAMVNITLNAILIPVYGAIGAAAATAATAILSRFVLWSMVRKRLRIRPDVLAFSVSM